MNSSLLFLLLIIIIVLLVVILLSGFIGRRRKHRTRRAHYVEQRPAPTHRAPSPRQAALVPAPHKPARMTKEKYEARYGNARSTHWPAVAREHLLKEPACMACGYKGPGLQVHHVKPFHLHPQLELDPRNLITLCEIEGREHHLLIGHLDDWESFNEHVRADVKRFYKMKDTQIRADPTWQKKVALRP